MSEQAVTTFDDLTERDERNIQRHLARMRELEETLRRFHEEARVNPDRWSDPNAAGKALGAAQELRDVDHKLHLLYLQHMRRDWARRAAVSRSSGLGAPQQVPPTPIDPVRLHEGRAFEARGTFYHAIDRLRSLPDEDARRHAERVDREQRAHLRWLLNLLAEVLPDAARTIDDTWKALRAGRAAEHTEEELRQPRPSNPGRFERWERQTADALVLLLEPLLPD